ncbi:hypothetical protein FACS1894137_03820 [Spirochaetia bacterium]|nr:hypothetical protein FACS1894137_03820 [Spirochaetia bacterium]
MGPEQIIHNLGKEKLPIDVSKLNGYELCVLSCLFQAEGYTWNTVKQDDVQRMLYEGMERPFTYEVQYPIPCPPDPSHKAWRVTERLREISDYKSELDIGPMLINAYNCLLVPGTYDNFFMYYYAASPWWNRVEADPLASKLRYLAEAWVEDVEKSSKRITLGGYEDTLINAYAYGPNKPEQMYWERED